MTNYFNLINLQLFADSNLINNRVNGSVTTGSTGALNEQGEYANPNPNLSAQMKTYYDKELIELAGPHLVHGQFAQKKPIPQGNGKTIEFRQFQPLPKATTPLSEGVTPNGKALTSTAKTATVEQYGDFVELSDIIQMTAIDPMVNEAIEQLADQAGRTLDTLTRDVLVGGTNVMFSPKKDASGNEVTVAKRKDLDPTAKLTVKDVQRAVAILRGQNAPTIDGQYYVGILHPFSEFDLMNDPRWERIQDYATPENRLKGEVGRVGGARFVSSTEAKYWNSTDDNCPEGLAVYGTVILGKNAYGETEITGGGLETIVKQLGYGDDPLNQRSSAGWKATHVAERLVETYMVRIESAATGFSFEAGGN